MDQKSLLSLLKGQIQIFAQLNGIDIELVEIEGEERSFLRVTKEVEGTRKSAWVEFKDLEPCHKF